MEMLNWMLEEVQKMVNKERWYAASWCRRETSRQLEKLAWVLEKLYMEEEGLDKLGKKNLLEYTKKCFSIKVFNRNYGK